MNNTNEQTTKFLPIWVWIIAIIHVVLVLFFSVATFMDPASFIPGATELNYSIQLYITRNVTVALAIIVALLFKSHKVLFTLLLIRVMTDISDVISVYAFNVEVIKESVPMVVAILIIPALVSLGYLWKRINQQD